MVCIEQKFNFELKIMKPTEKKAVWMWYSGLSSLHLEPHRAEHSHSDGHCTCWKFALGFALVTAWSSWSEWYQI
jgi:hypothetical protein